MKEAKYNLTKQMRGRENEKESEKGEEGKMKGEIKRKEGRRGGTTFEEEKYPPHSTRALNFFQIQTNYTCLSVLQAPVVDDGNEHFHWSRKWLVNQTVPFFPSRKSPRVACVTPNERPFERMIDKSIGKMIGWFRGDSASRTATVCRPGRAE